MNYVAYHVHSSLSLLDSCTSFKDYVDRATELGQRAIAFTEHGNIYNWIEKKMYCESRGIKYIHGVECYLTESLMTDDGNKVRDNYHTILLAKNYEGVKEINKLMDVASQEDHFYYKPRITFDEFFNISDNVIKISACLASPLRQYPGNKNGLYVTLKEDPENQEIADKIAKSKETYQRLLEKYDYYEIQPHDYQDQRDYNDFLYKASIEMNKPLIVGTDTHSINKYKAECRSILQKAKKIEYASEDSFDLTYKSYDELVQMFEKQRCGIPMNVILDAIEETNRMADMIEEFELDKSFKYAKLYDDDEAALKKRIAQKLKEKISKGIIDGKNPQYRQNILEEFRVFKKINMLGFMLFMSELVCWCWENGIPIGPCRGSVGGSTIAYITDIIDVDPIIWKTVFSRFANEDRLEIGDIDIDVSPDQRDLVYEHIINQFGKDYTAYILAIGTISDKGTIDEICRALDISLETAATIKSKYDNDPEKTRKEYPEVFMYFDGLVNTPISQSMHPAGIVVSPVSLPDNYGTFWADGKRILYVNMEECHEVSLVKYDILGLKNIQLIRKTCKYAGIKYPKSHEINWNDKKVWMDLTSSPVGIFQFEGDYAFSILKKYRPTCVNDLSLCNAALRPSGASFRDSLLARIPNKNPSQLIDDLLADNNGYLVFQEDTIKFLKNICGLSGSEADNVRRAIGRKQVDRLQAALPRILEGYCSMSDKPRSIAEEEAKKFLQIIEDSSGYQFGLVISPLIQ